MPSNEFGVGRGADSLDLDVLIIGGGFGGCYALHRLRKLGLRVHVFEAGTALGGVWHWNRYPGARVDSEIPYYQFSVPEIWRSWNWSERFPGHEELRAYFRHVDQVLQLSKDVSYSANVVSADFDKNSNKWIAKTGDGRTATCTYLICATGSSYKCHYPDFKNFHSFQGDVYHSARWPEEGVDTKGKRVAVIGAGSTGIQCIEQIAKEADHTTAYVRTASISLPMGQRKMSNLEQDSYKSIYKTIFKTCRTTASGLGYDTQDGKALDATAEEREQLWEELWSRGGFNFQVANYRDYLVDQESNKLMYEFWAKKTRPRIKNPKKRAFLVPDKAPFAFGTKRSSLEQDYYECIDQDNVDVVDLKSSPIREFTEQGIICEDGSEREFDIIVLATGYDAMTGSLTGMGLRGKDGIDMKERWKDGVFTHLGICVSGCPNFFMVYGPQAPTAFTNGPVFIEVQVDFIIDVLTKLREEEILSIEPQRQAEEKWKQDIQDTNDLTLFPLTNSWYMGANIPGKKREQLNYIGGIYNYDQACRASLQELQGFDVVYAGDRNTDGKKALAKEHLVDIAISRIVVSKPRL